QKTVVFTKNADLGFDRIDDFYSKAEEAFKNLTSELKHAEPETLFCNATELKKQLLEFNLVEFGSKAVFASQDNIITFNTTPQPAFKKQFNLLIDDLNLHHNKGYTNYIACV